MGIKEKLRSGRGETFTETLCGLLLLSFASVIFVTMIGTAARMNSKTMVQNETFYEAMAEVEAGAGSGEAGTLNVRIDGRTVSLDVTFYTKDTLTSYRLVRGEDAS